MTEVKRMVSIVLPACNEEHNIVPMAAALHKTLAGQDVDYQIIFVDDGSRDLTLEKLKELHAADSRLEYIALARNLGHQNALKAGLDHAAGDCVITMDADFQHPPELLPQFLDKWRQGYDVVTTIRCDDRRTPLLKRLTSRLFYRVLNRLSDINLHQGAADFRLLDRSVVEVFRGLPERQLFFRGMTAWVGFRQTSLPFTAAERRSGRSKYSPRRMIRFALTGITSFSIKPLRLSVALGSIIALLSFAYGIYAVWTKLFTDRAIPGWTSVLASVLFIGGMQLIVLGIIGEYIGKLLLEVKHRPHYLVREKSIT